MDFRKEGLTEEAKNKSAAADSLTVNEGLIMATMCIIGLQVDVHNKDGSVYSGIFFTADVDNEYDIVLKKARMIKKGTRGANVSSGSLIETLIIQSEDLVQIIAKGLSLPANGIIGYSGGDSAEDIVDSDEHSKREAKATEPNESNGDKKHTSQTRSSAKKENRFCCTATSKKANVSGNSAHERKERSVDADFAETEEVHTNSIDGRQVGNGSQEKQSDCRDNSEFLDERTTHEAPGLSLSLDACETQSTATVRVPDETDMPRTPKGVSSGRPTTLDDQMEETLRSDEIQRRRAPASRVSVAGAPVADVTSELFLKSSSTTIRSVPPNVSSLNKTAKESKLNPGAKMFSPSPLRQKSVTPPLVPTGENVACLSDHHAMVPISTAQHEVDISWFVPRSSGPLKFVPCSNVVIGNGGSDGPYVQPIVGQVVSRTPPVRYAGQYQNLQARPPYVHPHPQNVMVGRVRPLVCMHPISNDIQGAAGFSQATMRPIFTPHHLPKHQGSVTPQTVQLCMNPPIIASGQQPFAMPSPIPISQPYFPVGQPVTVPGSNGYFSTKFA